MTSPTPDIIRRLVDHCIAGDPESWAGLWRIVEDAARGASWKTLRIVDADRSLIDDLGQELGTNRPINPERLRAEVLAALSCVDYIVSFGEETPLRRIAANRPDVLSKGEDYRIDQVVGRDVVESSGGRVELIPLVPDLSATRAQPAYRPPHLPANLIRTRQRSALDDRIGSHYQGLTNHRDLRSRNVGEGHQRSSER